MARIYLGQKIGLETTITDDGDTISNIDSATVTFYYFKPGNTTTTPDGSLDGTTPTEDGYSSAEITAAMNDTLGAWRVQAAVTLDDDTYRAKTTGFTVYPVGM